jgi:alpha-L-rhamnosidase
MAWVYRYVAGIDTTPEGPGFKEIVVDPHLDPRMPSARAEYDSLYGKIVSDWSGIADGPFTLKLRIPPNTNATVFLPLVTGKHVTESGNSVEGRAEEGSFVVRVGSGSYNFELK